MADYEAQIDRFILKTRRRMKAVVRGSVQDVVFEANTTTTKGGKMRVDTGFLRASGRISLTGMPSGPSRPPQDAGDATYTLDEASITAGLAGVDLGDVIYFGWSAEYARHREVYDGFLESALMNWQKIVDVNVRKVKAAIR